MKAKELIAKLDALVKEHGDLEVFNPSNGESVFAVHHDEHGEECFLIE